MSTTTPKLGLVKPAGTEKALVSVINANSDLIDLEAVSVDGRLDLLEGRNQQFTGPWAAIGLVVGHKLGDTYRETDGQKKLWIFDGANWVGGEPGSYLIYAQSIAGGGVLNADGSVSFSNVGAQSLNGVFTARFRDYEISWDIAKSVPAATLSLRLRAAGADNTAAQYAMRRIGSVGAGYVESTTVSQDRFEFGMANMQKAAGTIRISDALTAGQTYITEGRSFDTDGGTLAQTSSVIGRHSVSSAYDGFTLFASSGNISGKVRVVGMV